jgi:peptidoglycan/LPS O-acetylase OafA/YrhL
MDAGDKGPVASVVVDAAANGTSARTADETGPAASGASPVATSSGGGVDSSTVGSAAARQFRLGNRPPLTGVRALCMIPVVVYHSDFRTFPGAWVPLQVFFVLSGFLITAMLSAEGKRNDRVSLTGFYSRRIVRLVPPLLFTVAIMALYASFVHVAEASQRLWGDGVAAMTYSDYRQALGHAPFFGYLAQTWSLAVEEQFYIIWAVLMVVAVAMHRRKLAYGFAITGMLFSVTDRLYQTYSAPHFNHVVFSRIYYAFDTRADALFVGCLLGLLATDGYFSRWKPWATRLLAVAAIGSTTFLIWILFSAPLWQENLVVWWLPLSTLASAVILVYFVISPKSIGSRLVGIAPLVFLGELSYAIYLIHFPVFLALQPGADGTHWSFWPTEVLRLAIVFGLACISWFLIEKPLMRWRQRSAARSGATEALPKKVRGTPPVT